MLLSTDNTFLRAINTCQNQVSQPMKHSTTMRYIWTTALMLSLSLSACTFIDPPEPIPAWLQIEPFVLQPNPTINEGSLSANVTHAWVSAGGQVLGIVNVPSKIPVLATGSQDILIDPVIKANGSIYYLRIYPFYERIQLTTTLEPDQVRVITPQTRYRDDAIFALIEDFEGPHLFNDDRDQDPQTHMRITTQPDEVFEGNASGFIQLTTDNPTIEVATEPVFDLLDGGKIFLEINYRSPDIDILFGLLGKEGDKFFPNYNYGIRTKAQWNKIYFDLTDDILQSQFDEGYKLGIFATLQGSEKTEARVWIDNIKLVHF